MGWGCYKHEWDLGSEAAQAKLDELIRREQDKGFPAWGRDSNICPACYEELEAALAAARKEAEEAKALVARREATLKNLYAHGSFKSGRAEGRREALEGVGVRVIECITRGWGGFVGDVGAGLEWRQDAVEQIERALASKPEEKSDE